MTTLDVDALPPEKIAKAIARLEAEKAKRAAENKLASYVPYDKQRRFHVAGAAHRERLLMAANQSGKTLAGGMECAMHATGRYPDWWQGRRFDAPTIGWVAGVTAETVRDTVQRVLVGRTGEHGTGSIPKETIVDIALSRGVPEAVDIIRVRHVSGGISTIGIKAYSDGRQKFQGETLELCLVRRGAAGRHLPGRTDTNQRGLRPDLDDVHAVAGRLRGRATLPTRQVTRPSRYHDDD